MLWSRYRIEMVGVTVDPALAVGRGLRRKMMTGRGVPVAPQLRSHRLYSEHFADYLPLLRNRRLMVVTGALSLEVFATAIADVAFVFLVMVTLGAGRPRLEC